MVFIEQIFLKILDSGNSNYHHKYLILNVFDKLSQNTKHLLEIFINYDCDEQMKDIFERMIDSLSKIAQGKFQRSEHSNIITPQEEYSLRLYAIQILVQMLRNINKTLILAVVEKPGTTFLNRKEFIDIIKDTLCDGLLKYSVSNEKTIFALSLSIFYCLFLHFREHLK